MFVRVVLQNVPCDLWIHFDDNDDDDEEEEDGKKEEVECAKLAQDFYILWSVQY
jgi:hypothetical protein